MKEYKRWIIGLLLLFVLFIFTKLTAPKPTDWSETLRDDDKNPYGTYILHQSLPPLFPTARHKNVDVAFYNFSEEIVNNEASEQVYVAIAPRIEFSKIEVGKMLSFLKRGNYALLSTENFSNLLWDSLGLKANTHYFDILDSSRVNFIDSSFRVKRGYRFYSQTIDNYFDSFPKQYPMEKLGFIDQSKEVNFIKIKIGKGALFVHAAPICFSNAFQLYKNNYQYTEKVLSYLPPNITTLYWDQYYSHGNAEEVQTPFRYFLSHFWLRIGFYLAWILLFIYVFFGGKRKQRIIPIVEPPSNTTKDFIETISSLYYHQNSGQEIFEKKVYHWLSFIRNHLQLNTDHVHENYFWEKLAAKSNIDLTFLSQIREEIIALQNQYNDEIFKRLYKNIETFYQLAKK